ncbi:MAG: hypothetical protein JW787_17290, partial [Sedimentisphaerales bacterium]|nr:hypothetical protein [Sedimentisphaerales bacterium]
CTNGEWLTLHPVLYREGKVVLDGTSYRIGVVDGNFDGKYNGIFSTPVSGRLPKCDIFAIDLNGNQEYDYHPSVESEVMPLSRFIKVKDQYYSIQVVKDGGSIEFRKADIQFGTLDLGGEDVALYFWSDSMHYQIEGSRKTWQLPVGKYGVSSMKLSEKNSEGEKFDFVAPSSTTGQLASFEIKADQTTRIPLGKPKKIVTSMERVGEEIKLSFSLVGKAGELYIPGAEKDGEMIPEPKFKVIDESGKVVHSGKFEYG